MFFLLFILIVGGALYSIAFGIMVRDKHAPTGSFEVIDGLQIHYKDIGPRKTGAPPIVLIHGASANLLDMEIAIGRQLAETRRVILIDRTGYGHSQRAEDGYRLDVQSRIISKLLKRMNVPKAIIVGQSFGASVSMSFALDHKDQVAGLVLLAPIAYRWPGGVAWYNHLATMPIIGAIFRWGILPYYGSFLGRTAVEKAFWPKQAPENYYDNAAMSLLFTPSRFYASARDVVGLYDEILAMEHRYDEISVPTKILAGTHDVSVLTSLHSIGLNNEIAQSDLAIIDGVGHTLQHGAAVEAISAIAEVEAELLLQSEGAPKAYRQLSL